MPELKEDSSPVVETQEQRSDRQYKEAKEAVQGIGKVVPTEGKEGHSLSLQSTTVVSAGGETTNMTTITQEQMEKNIDQMRIIPTLDSDGKRAIVTRTRKPATTTKSVDAQSIVEKMREQITCIEYIAGIDIPEITTPNSKEARDILIGLQKAIEQAKSEAIQAIQKL